MTAELRIAATGDLHCTRNCADTFGQLFGQISEAADILLICGDITDYGLPEEAEIIARELSKVRIPVLAVFGNHDFESGKQDQVREILLSHGIRHLDGELFEYRGVGFTGVKGFGGGFGRRMLEPWGESAIKHFVTEAVNEALKLESALARLDTVQRVVLMHYSPIEGTVQGEPPETLPFLGSSRLEDPLNRYRVTACFHGHAHHGSPEALTHDGVPVYNVSAPVLRRAYPDKPPFRLFTVALEPPGGEVPTVRSNGAGVMVSG